MTPEFLKTRISAGSTENYIRVLEKALLIAEKDCQMIVSQRDESDKLVKEYAAKVMADSEAMDSYEQEIERLNNRIADLVGANRTLKTEYRNIKQRFDYSQEKLKAKNEEISRLNEALTQALAERDRQKEITSEVVDEYESNCLASAVTNELLANGRERNRELEADLSVALANVSELREALAHKEGRVLALASELETVKNAFEDNKDELEREVEEKKYWKASADNLADSVMDPYLQFITFSKQPKISQEIIVYLVRGIPIDTIVSTIRQRYTANDWEEQYNTMLMIVNYDQLTDRHIPNEITVYDMVKKLKGFIRK